MKEILAMTVKKVFIEDQMSLPLFDLNLIILFVYNFLF